jgi:hypothetical protein
MGLAVSLLTESGTDLEDIYESLDGLRGNVLFNSKAIQTYMPGVAERLCATCGNIDLYQLLFRDSLVRRGYVPLVFPFSMLSWTDDTCPVCRLLAAVTKPKYQYTVLLNRRKRLVGSSGLKRTPKFGLHPVDMKNANGPQKSHESEILSEIVRYAEGVTMSQSPAEELIDLDVASAWLSLCQQCHSTTCAISGSDSHHPFRMIDCHTRRVTGNPKAPYFTLSYTWGPYEREHRSFDDVLPTTLPATIEDAIKVTVSMGVQYLWIDYYCINQEDSHEVAETLRAMDRIYRGSELTIIASAGDDPSYGLPGVSHFLKSNLVLGEDRSHLHHTNPKYECFFKAKSRWAKRAWTYQEALLSRRRAVFTEDNVYLECSAMYRSSESLIRLPDLHAERNRVYDSGGCDFPWDVLNRISTYYTLALSNPSDAINAILGVFRAFEAGPYAFRHVWGVPIFPPMPKCRKVSARALRAQDNYSAAGLMLGFCWKDCGIFQRRAMFPSWSWTGWTGSVGSVSSLGIGPHLQWDFPHGTTSHMHALPNATISFELQGGRILSWSDFHKDYDSVVNSTKLTKYIHITTWITEVTIIHSHDWEWGDSFCMSPTHAVEAKLFLKNGSFIEWRFQTSRKCKTIPRSCIALHIAILDRNTSGFAREPSGHGRLGLLVVGKIGNATERIGFGWISNREYQSGYIWKPRRDPISDKLTYEAYREERRRDRQPSKVPDLARAWKTVRIC